MWDAVRENLKKFGQREYLSLFQKQNSKLVFRRKQAKLQWLQDPGEAGEDDLSNVRWEASRHFRNKKQDKIERKINVLVSNIKNKNVKRPVFEKGYQSRTNLVKDERGDLLQILLKF
jgi:hypothetical protein